MITFLDYRRHYWKDYEIVEFDSPIVRYNPIDDCIEKVIMFIYKIK